MRWRPFTWLLLSLLFFVAAAFFWRLGDEWAAKKAPPTAASTNQPLPFKSATKPGVQHTPMRLLTRPQDFSTPAMSAAPQTNRAVPFANRLSNTTRPLKELLRSDTAILLQNALIDTAGGRPLSIPEHLRSHGDPGSYIVQSRSALDDAFRAELKAAGAEIVSYIPNNAYLVLASGAAARSLASSLQTQTVLPFEPYYKLQPSLLALAVEEKPLPADTSLNLLLFPGAHEKTLPELNKLEAEIIRDDRTALGPLVSVRLPAGSDKLPALAALPGVWAIESVRIRIPANDLSRATVAVSADPVTTNNYLGLTGSNVLVNVNDTGIDATHPDFAPAPGVRVLGDSTIALTDTNGHGTHVAGIIAGSGARSTNVNNASGSPMPAVDLQFRGKAPAAKLFSIAFDPIFGPFKSDAYLQETAARTNAFISNNGWTYGSVVGEGGYDIAAANYDAAVRDALPRVPGSRPLLYVFPAGNQGFGSDDGRGGSRDTIESPATAKNVLTVGAIEQLRAIANQVIVNCTTNGTNVTCQTNQPWLQMTDAPDQVAGFSARGNVGVGIEGDSGRFKPDVVAPGTFVVSTRSQQWDEQNYYTRHDPVTFPNQHLGIGNGLGVIRFIPDNATRFSLYAIPRSPIPFPGVTIYVKKDDIPQPIPGGYDFVGTNRLVITGGALTPRDQDWFVAVFNESAVSVQFDFTTDVTFSNANDNVFFQVLSNLNGGQNVTYTNTALETNTATHYYRYESGTSMAAADASGVLALMQDFLQNRLGNKDGSGRFTNSPALLKAMLINGARSAGSLYDFETTNTINFQGWGLINISNSIPGGLATPGATTNSMFFFDQSPSNSLATGQSHTRNFTVADEADSQPLRITLVWSDPPGNPIASTKLVNDLDLIVTNLDNGDVFFGNDIFAGNDFNLPWDTNGLPNLDAINNVENIYLAPPIGTRYSVTVVGRRVNVNAVTAHPDNVAQDYALVVSSGDGGLTNALSFTGQANVAASTPLVTIITNMFGQSPGTFGAILTRQHAGANTPLLGTSTVPYPTDANAVITRGITNQWHFYVFSNATTFTNIAFAAFAPPNLAVPVMGTRPDEGTNSSRREADIDIYVAQTPLLTNLAPIAISIANKALSREGTETIILTNGVPGGIYYVAVKAEDQRSAEYSLAAIASELPFSTTDPNGNVTLRGVPTPVAIPDASSLRPGAVTILGFSANPSLLLHRVIVSNVISHELLGDLVGVLTHQGDDSFATIFDKATFGPVTNALFVFDDSKEKNIPNSQPTPGPGHLSDFAGTHSGVQWRLTLVDNAANNHSGTNRNLSIFLEKQQDLTNGITADIAAGACREDFVVVPPDATNLTVLVSLLSGTGPLSFELCPLGGDPGQCKSNYITSVGGILSIDNFDVPPLAGGEYFVRVCNLGTASVKVRILAEISIGAGVPVQQSFAITNPVPILDDAITTITNFVTNHFQISALDVGLLINHPRISDLAITLISPTGDRILLFENRGALSSGGLGSFSVDTNGNPVSNFSVTSMKAFYTNDFEQSLVGTYLPGSLFQRWSVLTNSVAVVRDLTDLCIDNTVLVLGEGAVSNTIPTTNSTSYRLTFQVTHSPYIIGTVGWWPFDQDATDIFGGFDGLLCGNPHFVQGEVIGAFEGDGAGTSVTVPRCPDLDLGTGRGFTIEGWINPAVITNAAPIVEWNDLNLFTATPFGVQFWLSGGFTSNGVAGSLSANFWDTNSQPHIIETPFQAVTNSTPTNAAWQHVALSFDSATFSAKIYVNGVLVTNGPVGTSAFVPRTSGDLYFGYHAADRPVRTLAFKGGLDEFSVYNRALCDCEIAAIASAGTRGKYGTNVLTCPVTNTVQIGSLVLTNFVNGTNWSVTGPQWETDVIEFMTTGPAAGPMPIVIQPVGCPGAAVDNLVLSSLVTNFFDNLMHFTDDTNIAPVPIKFAPTPYTITNSAPTLVFSNGFENVSLSNYVSGSILPGSTNNAVVGQRNWFVLGNTIAVITNVNHEAVGSNVVVLPRSAVGCELPTVPGHKYQLNYSVRGPCAAGWWNGDIDLLSRRARDLIGGNNGAFISGAISQTNAEVGTNGLFFPGMQTHGDPGIPDIASKIELGDPPNLRFTNSFTIEGWVRPAFQTNSYITGLIASGQEESVIEQVFFRGDSRRCIDPYYLALEQSDAFTCALLFHVEDANSGDCGLTIEVENVLSINRWQHIAAVFERNFAWTNNAPWPTNQIRLYVNGIRQTNLLNHPFEITNGVLDGLTSRAPFADLDPNFSPGVAIGNRSRGEASEPFCGYLDELTVYARALTEPEIIAIANRGTFGKSDRAVPPASSLAKVAVLIDGDQKDVGYGDNSAWTQHSFTFIALRTNSFLTLRGLLPGNQVDTITLTELPTELTYQPEEQLSQLNGQDAFGEWRLEIWDDRAGASNNSPQLAEWQLLFHLLPSNPPPVISLSHCIPYISTLAPGSIQYFVVDVPQWATMATNILGFAHQRFTNTPSPVTVLFNQTNFPGPGDLALVGPLVSLGSTVISTSTVPPLLTGQPYFLAVTNPNPLSVDFSLAVCFDILTLTNCQPTTNFVSKGNIPRYFQFDVPTNSVPPFDSPVETTFWLTGANTNVTVVLSQSLPLPDLTHYDYISARPCTNDEILLTVTNSTPFPIQSGRWYAGVFNSGNTNVPFIVNACYSTNYPAIIPLTNDVPYVALATNQFVAPPGPPRWFFFEFSVTNSINAILFELYDLSGNADLVLQKDLPPGEWPYFDGSFEQGITPEQIVVRADYAFPDLRGNWFLGIYNNESFPVTYTIRASTPNTNGLLVSALPITYTFSRLAAPHGILIQWNSVLGEAYEIQFSTNNTFNTYVVLNTVIATTSCEAYEVPADTSGFIRIVQVSVPSTPEPVLKIQISAPNQVRLSWSTAFSGFRLQSAPSLAGPWTDVPLPVTVIGNEFVVFDTIGLTDKFYRLIK